jgi:trk system potassium uptake protein TrkA
VKIIVTGAGKVGFTVADQLAHEGHDITIIDSNPDKINRASNELDVICIEGNGASIDLLEEAGVRTADMLIAATGQDEINMICCMAARKLGTKYTVARIRNPEYLSQSEFLRETLGLSMAINPDLEAAAEISRILQFPSAARVETFSHGRVDMVTYKIPKDSKLSGMPLRHLSEKFHAKVLVCAVERGEDVFIPNGKYILHADDRISIAGSQPELRSFFMNSGAYRKPVSSVIIMGGSRIAIYLTKLLTAAGITVTIIERDLKKCEHLAETLPKARIIQGDGTRRDVLIEEGLTNADAFVALSGYDEDNIIISMYASTLGVGKVVTKVNEEHFSEMLGNTSLDCIVVPKLLVAQQITRYVRAMQNSMGSSVETLYRLVDRRVEALEFIVGESSRCAGRMLKELEIKPDILIASVIRGGKSVIPDGNTEILPGDRAIVVTTTNGLDDLDDILA